MLKDLLLFSTVFNDAPQPWQIGFQDSAAPSFTGIVELHNIIFFYLIIISIGVFWILFSLIYNYNHTKNSFAHKYMNHGTLLETIWTIVPALILILIAFPSFKLLYLLDEVISPTVTIKISGSQWYWSVEYSDYTTDNGSSIDFDVYMVPESDLEIGQYRLLDVDNHIIIPVDCHIRFIASGTDVLHSFAVPSLGIKIDCCPGRLNQVSVLVERTGTYYGQCSEICGPYHGFMPIVIEAVSVSEYLTWLESFDEINKLTPFFNESMLFLSTINVPTLKSNWVTGFTDAEGSFIVSVYKRSNSNNWVVRPLFELGLHFKDKDTLDKMKDFFGVGNIYIRKTKNTASFSVTKIKDLTNIIIPHFSDFQLQTQKRVDFELWTKIVKSMNNKEHLNFDGFMKILSLKSGLNKGLSKNIINKNNIEVLERPLYLANPKEFIDIDPNWIAGFVAGDGSFDINIIKRKSKPQVVLRFRITQHIRDAHLIKIITEYFGCGKFDIRSTGLACDFSVVKFSDIINKIIPFFKKYPIGTIKEKDFTDFGLVAEIMKNKNHLTKEGLIKIKKIKSNMNKNRILI